jgi:hypothetical protein
VEDTYPDGRHPLAFISQRGSDENIDRCCDVFGLAFSPASAAMMACTSDNMAKSTTSMSPGQTAANKELAMANADISNGKMRSACMHYMKAQKMSMTK